MINVLESLVAQLPDNIQVAGPDDALTAFARDPCIHDNLSIVSVDLWEEILNQKMHIFLGKTDLELKELVHLGDNGMNAFCCFVHYFVEK